MTAEMDGNVLAVLSAFPDAFDGESAAALLRDVPS